MKVNENVTDGNTAFGNDDNAVFINTDGDKVSMKIDNDFDKTYIEAEDESYPL